MRTVRRVCSWPCICICRPHSSVTAPTYLAVRSAPVFGGGHCCSVNNARYAAAPSADQASSSFTASGSASGKSQVTNVQGSHACVARIIRGRWVMLVTCRGSTKICVDDTKSCTVILVPHHAGDIIKRVDRVIELLRLTSHVIAAAYVRCTGVS